MNPHKNSVRNQGPGSYPGDTGGPAGPGQASDGQSWAAAGSRDPRAIIPGNPDNLYATARRQQRDADAFGAHGTRWRKVDFGQWAGAAHDAAVAKALDYSGEQFAFCQRMALTAQATTLYADVLTWAQGKARDAVSKLDQADRLDPPHPTTTDNSDSGGDGEEDNGARKQAVSLREDATHTIREAQARIAQAERDYGTTLATLRARPEGQHRILGDPEPFPVPPPSHPVTAPASAVFTLMTAAATATPDTLAADTCALLTSPLHSGSGLTTATGAVPTPPAVRTAPLPPAASPYPPPSARRPTLAPGHRPTEPTPPGEHPSPITPRNTGPTADTPNTTPDPTPTGHHNTGNQATQDQATGNQATGGRSDDGTTPQGERPSGGAHPSPPLSLQPSGQPQVPSVERPDIPHPPAPPSHPLIYAPAPPEPPALAPREAPVTPPDVSVPPMPAAPSSPDTGQPHHTPPHAHQHQPRHAPLRQPESPDPRNPLGLDHDTDHGTGDGHSPTTGTVTGPPDPARTPPHGPDHPAHPGAATGPSGTPTAVEPVPVPRPGGVEIAPGVWIPAVVVAVASGLYGLHTLRRRHAETLGRRVSHYPDVTPTGRDLHRAHLARTTRDRDPLDYDHPGIRDTTELPAWATPQPGQPAPWPIDTTPTTPVIAAVPDNGPPEHHGPPPARQPARHHQRPAEPPTPIPTPTQIDVGEDPCGLVLVWDLVAAPGIGIYGADAGNVTRAIMITTLAGHTRANPDLPATGRVIIPAPDALDLLDTDGADHLIPAGLHITPDPHTALDILDAAYHHRATTALDPADDGPPGWPLLVLILTGVPTDPATAQRLRDTLDAAHHHRLNITAVIGGAWPSGASIEVSAHPVTVTATHGPGTEHLHGARLYTLPTGRTRHLLTQLTHPNVFDHHTHQPDTGPADTWTDTTEHASTDNHTNPDHRHNQHDLSGESCPPRAPDPTDTHPQDNADTAAQSSEPDTAWTAPDHTEEPHTATPHDPTSPDTTAPTALIPTSPDPHTGPDTHHPTNSAKDSAEDVSDPAGEEQHPDEEASDTPEVPDAECDPDTPARGLRLRVFGKVHLLWTTPPDYTSDSQRITRTIAVSNRQAELLLYLALHPAGARREAIAAALWPDNIRPGLPTNTVNTTLSRLRTCVHEGTDGTVDNLVPATGNGECALDATLIDVDYWTYREGLDNHHNTTPDQRARQRLAAVTLHQGELGEGLTSSWIEPFRQDTIRTTLDAATSLTHTPNTLDPDLVLDALERARQLEPYNEKTYQEIIKLHRRNGRTDAATRTYHTLKRKLAEIDTTPTPETQKLITQTHQSTNVPRLKTNPQPRKQHTNRTPHIPSTPLPK
jgi:DNA-binding SARP family transcriptional activator